MVTFDVNASPLYRTEHMKGNGSRYCIPRERDLDFGEAQLEQLQLAKVLVQQIAGSKVATGTAHSILPTPLKSSTLSGIRVRALSIRV